MPSPRALLPLLLLPGCALMEDWGDYQFLSGPNGWSGDTRYADADADVRFDVATTAIEVSRDPDENRTRIVERIEEIADARAGVEIILFGETITGWYRGSTDDAENSAYQETVAEPVPGPTTDAVADLARDLGLHVGFGIAEDDGDLYNALVLVDPDGEIVAVHRKVLPVHSEYVASLDNPYTAGDAPTVVEIDGVPFGLVICNDMHSLEVAEAFADAGVRVVLSALADTVPAPDEGGWSPIPPIWNAWVVQANRYGEEGDLTYPGAISILDPAGSVRAAMNGEGWVAASIGVYR